MKRAPLTIAKLEDKLQTLVNKFVRLRDGKVCISCGTDNRDRQFHGGHFIAGLGLKTIKHLRAGA